MNRFIDSYSLEQRKFESTKMKCKYPNSICAIVEKAPNSKIAKIDKKKYLIPKDLTIGQFIYVLRKHIELFPGETIFIFINNILPPSTATIDSIYQKNQNEDGFLYINYSGENAFG